MLKQKMNINNREEEGKTPLMMAAWVGRVGVLTLLLTQPNIDIDARDANGYTGTLPCSSLLALGTRPHQAWGKPPSLWTLSRLATWRSKVIKVAEMTKDEYPEVIIDFPNLRNEDYVLVMNEEESIDAENEDEDYGSESDNYDVHADG